MEPGVGRNWLADDAIGGFALDSGGIMPFRYAHHKDVEGLLTMLARRSAEGAEGVSGEKILRRLLLCMRTSFGPW